MQTLVPFCNEGGLQGDLTCRDALERAIALISLQQVTFNIFDLLWWTEPAKKSKLQLD